MDFLNDKTKILIILALALVALYLYNGAGISETIKNEGPLTYEQELESEEDIEAVEEVQGNDMKAAVEEQVQEEQVDLVKRMRTKNTSSNGYKRSNYRDGARGGNGDNLNRFFEEGTQFTGDNSSFKPNGDNDEFATYVSNGEKKMSDEEKFNAAEFMPKETNNDWFEDVHAVSVKNRHLINVYRPIGVNTISTTLKNASRDLRGTPANPKTFVSPFLNSSIEPDHNIKGFC